MARCEVATIFSLLLLQQSHSVLAAAVTVDRAAQSAYDVPVLPGYGRPNSHIYAGFVDVNRQTQSQLYYIAYESRQAATEDTPVLVWLNGGPGASSFLGNFLENGPYKLQPNLTFSDNPFAWNDRQHLVYFDQPAGTGFSHCAPDGHVKTLDQMAEQFVVGLEAFLQRHPQFQGPLYLTGESFAGQYIPYIGAHLVRKRAGGDRAVNFKGVLIGNPGLDSILQYGMQPLFFRSHGLVDARVQHAAEAMVAECRRQLEKGEVERSFHTCADMSNFLMKEAGQPFLYNVKQWGDVYDDVYAKAMGDYMLLDAVAKPPFALHTGGEPWKNGDGTAAPNPVVNALINDTMGSSVPQLGEILEAGYRVGIYNGADDGSMCGHWPTELALEELQWRGKAAFGEARTILWQASGAGHPYGNARQGGGLSFVVVLNSGHMVPTDQPAAGLDLLHRFLDERSWTDFPAPQREAQSMAAVEVGRTTSLEAPLQLMLGVVLGVSLTLVVLRRSRQGPADVSSAPLLL